MARYEENSRLRTLADAVSGPFGLDSGSGGNGVWFSGPGVKGFDINEVSEEEGCGGVGERGLGSPDGMVENLGGHGVGNVEAAKEVGSGNGVSSGPDGKIGEAPVVGKNGTNGIPEDLNDVNGGEDGDGEDDGEYTYEHGFSVGDLVWGKIKSHPWWPGQIYDPKDASEYALKFYKKGRLLVAYFGDGSFAWCLPSQLIPFAEHFEDMSKQSISKTFVSAVQEAVDEIGRLVEMEMTCKCVPEDNRKGLETPPAENAGIKAGIHVPEGDIGKLLSFRYDSAELLAAVESIAESVSFANTLDLAILEGWLSAFSRTKGCGHSLPVFHEGLFIEGLEDKNRTEVMDKNDFSVPIEVPLQGPHEEDWASATVAGPDSDLTAPEDKVYHRRKQKSVAELMGEGSDMKFKNRMQKKAVNEENGNQSVGVPASATGKKRARRKTHEMTNGQTVCIQGEEAVHQNSLSSEWKEGENGGADWKEDEGFKGTEEISSPRERKKSKYLSPPYTNAQFGAVKSNSKKELENESVGISKIAVIGEDMAKQGHGKSSSKKELEKESVRICEIARIGERMTKAAGILLDASPLVKCNDQTVQEKLVIKVNEDGQLNSFTDISPPRNMLDERIIVSMDVNAPVNEVLGGVFHVAVNPLHSWDDNLLVSMRGFISSFRSSIYLNGANYKIYHKIQPGGKRKSSNAEQGNIKNGNAKLPEAKKSRQSVGKKINKKITQNNSDIPGLQRGAKASLVRLNDKKVKVKASPESQDYSISAQNKQVTSNASADDRSQLGSVRHKLEIMTSMLERCDGKIPPEEASKLDGEVNNLFDKVRKMTEAALC